MQNNINYIEEDEIDLKELFSTIWNNKFKILFLSLLITSLSIIYALKLPNSYSSKTVLITKGGSKSPGGGASALAAMAGINLGGGGGLDISSLFKDLLNDYSFQKNIIQKYSLYKKLSLTEIDKNLVFAANFRDVYDYFKKDKEEEIKSKDEMIYDTYEQLKTILSVSTDKESGNITLSATHYDRYIAKYLVEIYLNEMSQYVKTLDLKEINDQMSYYERELSSTSNIDLKLNINQLLSELVKKKVLSLAGEYYMVKQLTKPQIAYVKDKVKPKRALIIIVAFITSIILGIFLVFFIEFLKGSKEEDKKQEKIGRKNNNLSF